METGTGPASPTLPFTAGAHIDKRYVVEHVLGSGGMGAVVRVRDETLDNDTVALKLLYPHLVKDKTAFARFRNEVLIARQLSHPNIVRLYDFGEAGEGYYYISMEYVAGANLTRRIRNRRREPLTFEDVVRILHDICLGLVHAHRKGIIHRDIKPDNILLSEQGEVKITDFGLARSVTVDKGFTQSGEAVGTPYYMAPEQIRGEHADGRCDIYSLGLLAFELVTGRRPFHDDTWFNLAAMHLRSPLPEFGPEAIETPEWFRQFVEKASAKDPVERFQTAEEMLEVLYALAPDVCGSKTSLGIISSLSDPTRNRSARSLLRKRSVFPAKSVVRGLAAATMLAVTVLVILPAVPSLQPLYLRLLTRYEQTTGEKSWLRVPMLLQAELTLAELKRALAGEDHNTIRLLGRAGLDLNTPFEDGRTPLQLAVEQNNAGLIPLLVELGAAVNQVGEEGEIALVLAARLGKVEQALALLAQGAEPNARDENGRTPLMHAISAQAIDLVQRLLETGAYVNITDKQGMTPLLLAAQVGDAGVVQLLLQAQSDVNGRSADGFTPLMFATQAGNASVMRMLIDAGADTAARNVRGQRAFDLVGDRAELKNIFYGGRVEASTLKPRTKTKLTRSTAPVPPRLVVVQQPQFRWAVSPDGAKLMEASVRVRNDGGGRAQEVGLRVQTPDGEQITLEGPSVLKGGEEQRYAAAPQRSFPRQVPLRLLLQCENCSTSN